TPAYMAPEQWDGGTLDARADQFSFCMSVWESLCGSRVDLDALPGRPDALVPVPPGVRMPGRVRRALSRGLSRAPEERFASMEALLAVLAPPRGRWVLPALAGVGGLMGAAGLALGWIAAPTVEAPPPCMDTDRPLAERWTDARRQAIHAVDPALVTLVDDWSERWRKAARQACEEVHVEQLRPEASLGPRRACLQQRLDALDVLLQAAGQGSAPVSAGWLRVLDPPAVCLAPALLEGDAEAPPDALRPEISEIHRALLAARWGMTTLDLAARRADAARLHARAVSLGYAPLEGLAAQTLGQLAREAGERDEARRWLGRALDVGLVRDPLLAIDAWLGLSAVAIDLDLDPQQVEWLDARLQPALQRMPEAADRAAIAQIHRARGLLLEGRLEPAEQQLTDAVARLEAEPALADPWEHAVALRMLASVVERRGRPQRALELHARARALERRLEGPRPREGEGTARFNEGLARLAAGDIDQAEHDLRRALELLAAEYGPADPHVAAAHVALVDLYDQRGDVEAARHHARQADRQLADLDPLHPDRASVLSALGTVDHRAGDFAAAAASYRRALTISERHLDADAPELAWARSNLAEALHELGRDGEAEVLLTEALGPLERSLGPAHPDLAIPLKALGAVALARGDVARSLALLERAMGLGDPAAAASVERAQTRWQLAQALRAADQPVRAQAEAQRAAAEFAALGPGWAAQVDAIERWAAP
ncbi:MAG: tetratricopeptide repeat protein, partial [Myxococcales bacterium]|nr:tetratricopeptide repeat protein [Myxococcales bacterium]